MTRKRKKKSIHKTTITHIEENTPLRYDDQRLNVRDAITMWRWYIYGSLLQKKSYYFFSLIFLFPLFLLVSIFFIYFLSANGYSRRKKLTWSPLTNWSHYPMISLFLGLYLHNLCLVIVIFFLSWTTSNSV